MYIYINVTQPLSRTDRRRKENGDTGEGFVQTQYRYRAFATSKGVKCLTLISRERSPPDSIDRRGDNCLPILSNERRLIRQKINFPFSDFSEWK